MATVTEWEAQVRALWKDQGWCLYTTCSGCGQMAHCAGKSRDRMKCLTCYDLSGAGGLRVA